MLKSRRTPIFIEIRAEEIEITVLNKVTADEVVENLEEVINDLKEQFPDVTICPLCKAEDSIDYDEQLDEDFCRKCNQIVY